MVTLISVPFTSCKAPKTSPAFWRREARGFLWTSWYQRGKISSDLLLAITHQGKWRFIFWHISIASSLALHKHEHGHPQIHNSVQLGQLAVCRQAKTPNATIMIHHGPTLCTCWVYVYKYIYIHVLNIYNLDRHSAHYCKSPWKFAPSIRISVLKHSNHCVLHFIG